MSIKLINDISWNSHRYGWGFVLDLLRPHTSDNGILLDGFIDSTFGFDYDKSLREEIIPYKSDWIGFWHHPVNIAPWLNQNVSPYSILESSLFKKSVPNCKGIFTFSDYLTNYLKNYIEVPISTLYHPTNSPSCHFNFDSFTKNKKIIQIGAWSRNLTSFYSFKSVNYKKYHLLGANGSYYLKKELDFFNMKISQIKKVGFLDYVCDELYDRILSESVVYTNLYDSSANNTIIECIARHTPIIVNNIPASVEYLGPDYPLFFHNISEIPELLKDLKRVEYASQYLAQSSIQLKITPNYFIDSFLKSPILKNLSIYPKHPFNDNKQF